MLPPADESVAARELRQTRDHIASTLREVDAQRKAASTDYVSLEDTWREVCAYTDTNGKIALLLDQLLVQFQDHYTRSMQRMGDDDEYLARMEHDDKCTAADIAAMRDKFEERAEKRQKMSTEFAKTATKLANEIRQCQMQSKYQFHVSHLETLYLVMRAAIHQEIHDQRAKNRLAETMSSQFGKIWPVSVSKDIGGAT